MNEKPDRDGVMSDDDNSSFITHHSPLIPRLRFPEFREAGEWEKKKLNQIAKLYKGKGISKADIAVDGSQPCIRYGELYTVYGDVIDGVVSKTNITASNLFLSKANDVIIPSSGETKIDIATASCVIHDNIALGSDLNVIRSNMNGAFLSYNFNSALKYDVAKIAQGDTVVHLYATQLKLLDVTIPSKKEQQKIADCLSSLDALITAHSQKLDALKAHKKGLMQQLFPREGETVPRLRFPEFRDAGEWEVKKLDDEDVSEFVKKRISLNELEIDTFVSTENILPDFGGIKAASKLPPSGSFTAYIKDDILIANIRPYLKKIWVANRKGGASNDVVVVRPSSKIIKSFLSFILKSESFISYVMKGAKGVKMPRGDISMMKDYSIALPGAAEQQKIANCLSSLDALITAQGKKIDALKAHKKGLMQQLFPVMDEVRR